MSQRIVGTSVKESEVEDARRLGIRKPSPYSASKAAADLLANLYFVAYGLQVTVTRSTNTYGPNQHPE